MSLNASRLQGHSLYCKSAPCSIPPLPVSSWVIWIYYLNHSEPEFLSLWNPISWLSSQSCFEALRNFHAHSLEQCLAYTRPLIKVSFLSVTKSMKTHCNPNPWGQGHCHLSWPSVCEWSEKLKGAGAWINGDHSRWLRKPRSQVRHQWGRLGTVLKGNEKNCLNYCFFKFNQNSAVQ